ncbi:sulfotransferase family protein [bacterium BMS3Bbin14]|nr:sulfotransferase family protein [bacterium BMS3Bbin14]
MTTGKDSKKKILFIHVPKCAGVSITQALEKKISIKRMGPHCRCRDIFSPQGRLSREDYFTFTFVRNPWERLVSTFFYILKGGRAEIDARRRDLYLKKYKGDFRSFVLDIENWINIRESDSIYPHQFIPHFRPQHEFVCDENGKSMVDFVGRVEDIKNDFKRLCAALSVDGVHLSKTNRSSHGRYHRYYDEQTREIVAQYYSRDIELFSYQFQPGRLTLKDVFRFLIR